MFQFFQMLLGYKFPQICKECNKECNVLLTQKWEENISKFYFLEPLRFRQTCHRFLLSKFASQLKLIQSVVGLSCLSHGPMVPCPRVASLKSQGSSPGFQSRRSQGPGPRVSGPDFRLCPWFQQFKYRTLSK